MNNMVFVVYTERCENGEQTFDVEGVAKSKEKARKIMEECIEYAKTNWSPYTNRDELTENDWQEKDSGEKYTLIDNVSYDFFEVRMSRPLEIER